VRIAINAALLGNRHTGVGKHVVGLIQSLTCQGHEVVVYGSSPFIPRGAGVTQEETPQWIAFDAGRFAGWLRMLWNVFVLPIRIKGSNIDVIVSQNAEGALWGSVPQVMVVHDLIPLFYPEEAPRLGSYYRRFLPLVLKHSAAVVTVSQHTRRDLLLHYKLDRASVHVAYNGLAEGPANSDVEATASLPTGPYFLFVGTFSPRKNLQTVIRAFAKVQDRVRESLLIVAYPDKWASACFGLADELGVRNRIIHRHGLTVGEMSRAYAGATALYLLSEYEGFGFPPLEAMVAGTPAVVSDSTALAEVVGDAAIKIGAHDIVAASETMMRLSADSAYGEKFSQLGMQRATSFTWSSAGSTIGEILSGIVRSRDDKSQLTRAPQ
jgi:glycosyltransferase involved in cell wall biosynthesis